MFWLLLSVAFALENSTHVYESVSDLCKKMQICYQNIPIPVSQPLLQLSIEIKLTDLDEDLTEYPTPKPLVYIRFDAVPDEEFYDYKFELKSSEDWKSKIDIPYPKKANYFVLRLDGGLLDQSHLMPAYTVYGWSYKIKTWAYYCESQFATSSKYLISELYSQSDPQCDIEVLNAQSGAINVPTQPVIYEVPAGTESLIISVSDVASNLNLTASPDNFIFVNSLNENYSWTFTEAGRFIIASPQPGYWHFLFFSANNTEFSYEIDILDYEWDKNGNMMIGNSVAYQDSVKSYTSLNNGEIKMEFTGSFNSESSVQYHRFMVLPDHTDERFGTKIRIYKSTLDENTIYNLLNNDLEIKIQLGSPPTNTSSYLSFTSCKTSNVYCKVIKESSGTSIVIEFRYLKKGMNYISLKFPSLSSITSPIYYQLGIFRTKVGDNICHSEYYYLYNEVVYTCYCMRNTAGPYCEKQAFSDTIYDLGLTFLITSNLAMIPALVVGFIYLYYGEIAVYGSNMIASMIYHTCDWQYYCFNFNPLTLLLIDFLLSYMSIMVCLVHVSRLKNPNIKTAAYVFLFVLLLYIGLNTAFRGTLVTFMPPLIAGLIPISRYIYIVMMLSKRKENKCWSWHQVKWFFITSKLVNLKWGLAAIVSFALALTSRFLELNDNYYITHSCWHIFIMLTPFFVFFVFPRDQKDFEIERASTSELISLETYAPLKTIN